MTLPVADQYTIHFGALTESHFAWLHERDYAGWVVFVDTNTAAHCLPLIEPYLTHPNTRVISCEPGEINKHLGTCRELWQAMFDHGVGRRWCAICLGGGVLEDMAGFVASTFKRGIDFLQIPTTLLSQVDSSVGGKLGVDFAGLKNSIGIFRNPIAVWIDAAFLRTLPPREVRSGYAEMIKHALIADRDQWTGLEQLTNLAAVDWEAYIPASVNIKREIVLEDPFEKGARKALNFGHTIGHAIESYWLETDRRMLHGEAIAAGMIMEAWLSVGRNGLDADEYARIETYLLGLYGHRVTPESAFPELLRLMGQDKKNDDARINFTLLAQAGRATVNQTVAAEPIVAALRYYNALGVSA